MVKTIFIETKTKSELNQHKALDISKKLPKNIAIAYSIQYKSLASKIKELLSSKHSITKLIQVLGCSSPKFTKDTEAILLISSGRFHAVSLAYETKIPVYILDHGKLEKISKTDIKNFETRQKAAYMKFLNAKNIGIIISTKPGQSKLKRANDLQDKIKNKDSYLFIANDININEFENFNIDSWINTACPRMDLNSPLILNIKDLEKV